MEEGGREDAIVAVVTGGNKGIGFEICRSLAARGVVRVVLTARNECLGRSAANELGSLLVEFHQLDVTDPAGVAQLAEFVENKFGKLDILVNNAGISGVEVDEDKFKAFKDGAGFNEVYDDNAHLLVDILKQDHEKGVQCLETNYYGAKRVTEALLPLLRRSKSPRIVNVSSNYGELQWINNEKVKAELEDIERLTEERIDEIIRWFLRDFKEGRLKENGWPLTVSAYKVSKVSMNAYTRLLARKFPDVLVNAVHPGYVRTDITMNTGLLTPEEGARGPVMLALLPDGGPTGKFFSDMKGFHEAETPQNSQKREAKMVV